MGSNPCLVCVFAATSCCLLNVVNCQIIAVTLVDQEECHSKAWDLYECVLIRSLRCGFSLSLFCNHHR